MFLLSSKNENISPLSSSYARTNESMNTLRKCEVSWFSWISPKSIKINQSTLFVWVFCFVCMYVLCVPHMCRPEELALQLLWASIELCELNLGPLKEQLVIWTIEPSLQPATIGGGGFTSSINKDLFPLYNLELSSKDHKLHVLKSIVNR